MRYRLTASPSLVSQGYSQRAEQLSAISKLKLLLVSLPSRKAPSSIWKQTKSVGLGTVYRNWRYSYSRKPECLNVTAARDTFCGFMNSNEQESQNKGQFYGDEKTPFRLVWAILRDKKDKDQRSFFCKWNSNKSLLWEVIITKKFLHF